jgi:fido (protein-threonine AMPylation protein)
VSDSLVGYPPRDWERIKKLGLKPDVFTPEMYSLRVMQGMRLVSATLALKKEIIPSIDTIKGLHFIAFEGVHPWAGQFRVPGQEVRAGKLICSLASDISKELTSLSREMHANPLKGTKQYKAEVLAFYHASLLAIHPFLDGNGRLSRTILDHQCQLMLGHPLQVNYSRPEYLEALTMAQQEGNLEKLSLLIGRKNLDKNIAVDLKKAGESIPPPLEVKKLRKREEELLIIRRKLGFVGSEIETEYGIGGFPKPLTEKDAQQKAIAHLKKSESLNKLSTEELSKQILEKDKVLNQQRVSVSSELISIREKLIRTIGKEKSQGLRRRRQ